MRNLAFILREVSLTYIIEGAGDSMLFILAKYEDQEALVSALNQCFSHVETLNVLFWLSDGDEVATRWAGQHFSLNPSWRRAGRCGA